MGGGTLREDTVVFSSPGQEVVKPSENVRPAGQAWRVDVRRRVFTAHVGPVLLALAAALALPARPARPPPSAPAAGRGPEPIHVLPGVAEPGPAPVGRCAPRATARAAAA